MKSLTIKQIQNICTRTYKPKKSGQVLVLVDVVSLIDIQ